MRVITIEDQGLAIPANKINYAWIKQDPEGFWIVQIGTSLVPHNISFATIDEAEEFFEYVCDQLSLL